MTIEQLEKANEINRKISTLKHFESKCYSSCGVIAFGEEEMSLLDFPDLMVLISSYFSDKIIEQEKQLEEL